MAMAKKTGCCSRSSDSNVCTSATSTTVAAPAVSRYRTKETKKTAGPMKQKLLLQNLAGNGLTNGHFGAEIGDPQNLNLVQCVNGCRTTMTWFGELTMRSAEGGDAAAVA
jgi:hypothetical protein